MESAPPFFQQGTSLPPQLSGRPANPSLARSSSAAAQLPCEWASLAGSRSVPPEGQLPTSASPFPPSLPGHPAAAQLFPLQQQRLWLRLSLRNFREPPTPCALHLDPTTHHRCFWSGNPGSRRRAPGNEIGAPTAPPGLARPHLDEATHRLSNLRRPGFEIKDLTGHHWPGRAAAHTGDG